MNVYFACSITGGRDDQVVYKYIVDALLDDDHHVPTALLATSEVIKLEEIIDPVEVYQRDVDWIEACDLLVAEISTPSHGVGYEIGHALGLGKPVLCLHRRGIKVSKMISGNQDPNMDVLAYDTPDDAVHMVRAFIEKVIV